MTVTPIGSQIWPPVIPRTLERQVWDSTTARGIPAVGRALGIYSILSTCPMEAAADNGSRVLQVGTGPGSAPRILDQPDPDMATPTFLTVHLEDWLLHGNACHLVTARDRHGRPAAGRWYPPHRWGLQEVAGQPVYRLDGREVPREDVVHARRGADPSFPWRGMGVVEQHLHALNRVGLQDAAESANLRDRGVPSVAVIAPNVELDPADADAVADKWVERFSGPTPRPGIFPKDTQVIPLSWNPNDQQMTQARQLGIKDVANMFNLDGYWLGAEGSSHTYRSPGPMFLALTKVSLRPILAVFEDVWGRAWLPHGTRLRFNLTELLRDDLGTMLQAFTTGSAYFPDKNEPRQYLGFPPLPEDAFPKPPVIPAAAPADDEQDEQDPPTAQAEDDDDEQQEEA